MKNTYGDIFHKPTIIKQKENEVLTKIIKDINKLKTQPKDKQKKQEIIIDY